ncbi:hypothetical protein AWM75_00850 [Aerococcus urinaehominis]|uniref:Uncharacterized protein n=1 Tax=Aerococcus urinaehominis TaxID=128944 RepID=A0A0X8FK93_9LACT|nr:hypothetical protein [Aerococcus urinaehominis]AMB98629.1 hypothetical protein AWM75_00850 [Aerococcus urinaehominis]SDL95926.1 niacin transporter [Aerococcus urinaehominis]
MNRENRIKIQRLTVTALLLALGILIPMIMPVKLVIGPASYTLASHVPVDMAIYMGPAAAVTVGLGTALGFLFAGFPLVIVGRSLTHVIYGALAAYYLRYQSSFLGKTSQRVIFSSLVNLVHGILEVIVVYLMTGIGTGPLAPGYFYTLFVLVGLGTLIHGMVDFEIAYQVTKLVKPSSPDAFELMP